MTALLYAGQKGKLGVVRYLIENKDVDKNQANNVIQLLYFSYIYLFCYINIYDVRSYVLT